MKQLFIEFVHTLGYRLLSWPKVADVDRQATLNVVRSTQCSCGNRKRISYPFCNGCAKHLTISQRKRLSLMLRRGFVMAYQEAVVTLALKRQTTHTGSTITDLITTVEHTENNQPSVQ